MAKKAVKTSSNVNSSVLDIARERGLLSSQTLEAGRNLLFRGVSIYTNPTLSDLANLTTEALNSQIDMLRVVKESGDTAQDILQEAYRARILNDLANEEEVVESPSNSDTQSKIVDRDLNEDIPATVLTVTSTGTSDDVRNKLFSEIYINTRGEPDSSERSTGIQIKPDSRATLSLTSVSGNVKNISIRNFFITGVREDTSEKFQIVQTFGSDYIFFFNRKPLIYTINGVFYNTQDKQWRNEFRYNYDSLFRGTELVKNRNKAVFTYDDVVRHGYLLNLSYNTESNNPNAVPFSFSMFIIKESRIGLTPGREGESYQEYLDRINYPSIENG